eukprot:TRINITY_DN773193_c0_g1_i1.p1 TRINITY_DN773193_c0_g1~~TRINITY_DN773193_c0_g1_i1.p1  ORF type:complete len:109 (-),score=10.62 TRINITY_DN773193_c0_g1_i1:172-498(-)
MDLAKFSKFEKLTLSEAKRRSDENPKCKAWLGGEITAQSTKSFRLKDVFGDELWCRNMNQIPEGSVGKFAMFIGIITKHGLNTQKSFLISEERKLLWELELAKLKLKL